MVQVKTLVDTMDVINLVAGIFNRDQEHSFRVTGFSLEIFDQLLPLHNYGPDERRLLEMASILHDIGYSQPELKPHYKTSRDLILAMNIPGITDLDKLTFALIARYHAGEQPDVEEHGDFAELPEYRQEVVKWLAGILRVADAFDCKHLGVVRKLEIDFSDRQITFTLNSDEDCRKQIKRAQEKEDLLIKMSGRDVKYRC